MFRELNHVINYLGDILYARPSKISFFLTSLKLNPRKLYGVLYGEAHIARHYLVLLFMRALDGRDSYSRTKAIKKLVENYSL